MTEAAEWTAERLLGLPERVVVELTWRSGYVSTYIRVGTGWQEVDPISLQVISSHSLAAGSTSGSIRVVSVPVDALLSDETVAVTAVGLWGPDAGQYSRRIAGVALRGAIAHVTGEPV